MFSVAPVVRKVKIETKIVRILQSYTYSGPATSSFPMSDQPENALASRYANSAGQQICRRNGAHRPSLQSTLGPGENRWLLCMRLRCKELEELSHDISAEDGRKKEMVTGSLVPKFSEIK